MCKFLNFFGIRKASVVDQREKEIATDDIMAVGDSGRTGIALVSEPLDTTGTQGAQGNQGDMGAFPDINIEPVGQTYTWALAISDDGDLVDQKLSESDIRYIPLHTTSAKTFGNTIFPRPLWGYEDEIHTSRSVNSSEYGEKMYLLGATQQSSGYMETHTNAEVYAQNKSLFAANGFYTTSDERKKFLEDSVDCNLDELSKIPKKYFRWKNDENGSLNIGVSAQSVRKYYPELVNEDENGFLSLDYSKLSVIALAAIDELHKENKKLEKRIKALESNA